MFFCCYLLPSFEFQPDYFEFCWALWSCLYYIIISYHHTLSSSIFIIFFVPSIVMILSPQGDELHEPATECWRLVRRCFKYARMFPVQVAPAKGQGSWIDHRRNWNPLGSEFDPIYLMFVHVFFILVPICSFGQIFDRTTKQWSHEALTCRLTQKPQQRYGTWPIYLFALHLPCISFFNYLTALCIFAFDVASTQQRYWLINQHVRHRFIL